MNPPNVRDNAAFCSRTRDSEALSAVSSATFSISSDMTYQNEKKACRKYQDTVTKQRYRV